MMFCVSVPVLSEQMQDVEPSVSTPAWERSRDDAIFMNASSLPRRDGPDVFQRLKFEQGTTHESRRRRTKGRRGMPSRFLTMTFFVYIRLAVSVRQTVTVASSPSGTCVARRRHDATATLSRGAWALWRLHRRRRGGAVS